MFFPDVCYQESSVQLLKETKLIFFPDACYLAPCQEKNQEREPRERAKDSVCVYARRGKKELELELERERARVRERARAREETVSRERVSE